MSVMYYCGVDEFTRLTPHKVSRLPEKVDVDIKDVVTALDFVVYSKISAPFAWFVKGFIIDQPSEIFSNILQIDQVQICKSTIYGLSTSQNKLYKLILEFSGGTIHKELSEISRNFNATPTKLLQIAANDNSLFILDDTSGIYQGENLLFRAEGFAVTKIATGFDHVLMLSDVGAVYSFGNGSRGQLGHPDIVMRCDKPMRIEFFDDLPCTITDIACGGWHSLTLTSDGDVYSFGWNPAGQLGHSSDRLSNVIKDPYPVDLGSGTNPIVGIAAGARHSIALLKNGDVYSWGWNKYGQLGTGDTVDRPCPTIIQDTFTGKPRKVSAGRWGSFIFTKQDPS